MPTSDAPPRRRSAAADDLLEAGRVEPAVGAGDRAQRLVGVQLDQLAAGRGGRRAPGRARPRTTRGATRWCSTSQPWPDSMPPRRQQAVPGDERSRRVRRGTFQVRAAAAGRGSWQPGDPRARRCRRARPAGTRRAPPEALGGRAAEPAQQVALLDGLDALGDGLQAQAAGQPDDRLGDREVLGPVDGVADERAVDLHAGHRQLAQEAERGVAGAEVVEVRRRRPSARSASSEARAASRFCSTDGLGDLEDQRPRPAAASGVRRRRRPSTRPRVVERAGREVHRDVRVRREVAGVDRRGDVEAGAVEHPAVEVGDEAVLLGERHERARRDVAADRVVPAGQRLDADQPVRAEVEDGLVVQVELVEGERLAQLGGEPALLAGLPGERGVEDLAAGAAAGLGLVHRDVGVLEQGRGVAVERRGDRDADAGADAQRAVGGVERLADRLDDLPRPSRRRRPTSRPGQTRTNSSPPERATMSVGRASSRSRSAISTSTRSPTTWPCRSSTARNWSRSATSTATGTSPAPRVGERLRQPVGQVGPVRQAGQRVVHVLPDQLGLELAPVADVAGDAPTMPSWCGLTSRLTSASWPSRVRRTVSWPRTALAGAGHREQPARLVGARRVEAGRPRGRRSPRRCSRRAPRRRGSSW